MKQFVQLTLISILLLGFSPAGEDPSKALIDHHADLFRNVFRAVNEHYVDSLDPARLSRVAIDAMMRSLDPYSVYFDEYETNEREKTWRGQLYAGIGAGVMPRDSMVMITEPYEGYGADLNDLRTGDIIHSINGEAMEGKSFEEVLKKLRGEPDTEVEVTVSRPSVGKITKKITRRQIFTKSILFHHVLNDSTGYINLSQFLRESDSQFAGIVNELKVRGAKRLVIDLRDNIGGLVQEAVNCLSLFLPKGTLVCRLKGKHPATNYDYITSGEPIDTVIPIVILANQVTVSSGEIFAGAMQDLDRAVILGQRTFGKGFVQGTRYPGSNTSIYITAARYYTPSGRCIQEFDYSQKDAVKLPDSLKTTFKTRTGRPVNSLGGIEPDVKLAVLNKHELVTSVLNSGFMMDFVTRYRNTHDLSIDPSSFSLPEEISAAFIRELMSPAHLDQFVISAEKDLESLEQKLKKDNMHQALKGSLSKLKKNLRDEKIKAMKAHRKELETGLEKELVKRYLKRSGLFVHSLHHDPEILSGIRILKDAQQYRSLLNASVH